MYTRFNWMSTEELIKEHQHSKDEVIQEFINKLELLEKESNKEDARLEDEMKNTIVTFIEEVAEDAFFDELAFLLSRAKEESKSEMKKTTAEVLDLVVNRKQMVHNTVESVWSGDY